MSNLIFGKWDTKVTINDPGLGSYIKTEVKLSLFTQGRHSKKSFGRANTNIVERLINNMMRSGTGGKLAGKIIRDRGGTGKKAKMYKIAKDAFEIINKKTGANPLEVFVRALENAAPREETTRVRYGGISYPIAVDVSPQRRVDFALRNIGKAFVIRSFDNKKKAAEALAEELILASNNDAQSHAVAKKIDIERMAKGSR
jgi:small subunit ribosomal protein S7